MKMLLLGDAFPNFTARTTHGTIDFHKWIDTDWAVLFSHPSDFTPVCTTELAQLVKLMPQFRQRGVKVIGLSCDSIASHTEWCKDINFYAGNSDSCETPFPLIDDSSRKIANLLGMLDKDELDGSGLPLTARAVFIVDSNKKFRLSILYPATTGRNFGEILRVLDSLILADKYKVATPVDWKQGQDCMVLPNVPEDQINLLFPRGVTTHPLPSGKPYLRQTPCPEVE